MIFNRIKKIIVEQLNLDEKDIEENTSFKELKVDSLELFQIIIDIEEEFDVQIEDAESIKTVQDAVKIVEEKINIK
ncbi:acyl carrier protein [Clostridium kluyveri]|uniref:Acyl carrier protein n=1 Tax=Clostridium kluyveri TaxID=1534 RepID=A0A1L5F381_CLOKL|nr:acyl carrier protein [Clostridium kluyveri]APM37456.1 acyl carrier protein [Clostridium kluyveri]UZQ52586.1 acyl carrier protein [Clostridium kluyveri]